MSWELGTVTRMWNWYKNVCMEDGRSGTREPMSCRGREGSGVSEAYPRAEPWHQRSRTVDITMRSCLPFHCRLLPSALQALGVHFHTLVMLTSPLSTSISRLQFFCSPREHTFTDPPPSTARLHFTPPAFIFANFLLVFIFCNLLLRTINGLHTESFDQPITLWLKLNF